MTEAALLRVLGSLALIVIVLLAFAWLAKRRGWLQHNVINNIRVISSHRVGPRSHITIVDVEDARLVLGITQTQINLLHKIDPKETSRATEPMKGAGVFFATEPTEGAGVFFATEPTEGAESLVGSADFVTSPDSRGYLGSAASTDPVAPADSTKSFSSILKKKLLWLVGAGLLTSLAISPTLSYAQALLPALTAGPTGADGSQTWSLSVQTLVLLTLMSFLPAMLLTMTGFTRIVIVLGLLRNAMGTGASPPNSVLIGLSLFLTFFAMSPVFDQVYIVAWEPLSSGAIELQEALQLGVEPFREFMLRQTRDADLIMFANMANITELESPESIPLRVLIPSFVTSELKTAFQIGFTIFIPFLIIDLLVASTLMSLGMMMVPPVTIALPFKLMLFVLADGWHLLLGSLARSFYQ